MNESGVNVVTTLSLDKFAEFEDYRLALKENRSKFIRRCVDYYLSNNISGITRDWTRQKTVFTLESEKKERIKSDRKKKKQKAKEKLENAIRNNTHVF